MKIKGLLPRLLYPERLSIKKEDQIRSFPHKRSLKEYTSTKLALQEMLWNCFKKRKLNSDRERNTGRKNWQ